MINRMRMTLTMFVPATFAAAVLSVTPTTVAEIRGDCEPPGELVHPQRLLVRFEPTASRSTRDAIHQAAQAKSVLWEYHVVDGLQLVQVSKDQRADAVAVYQNHPEVLYAEPDYYVYPDEIPDDADFGLLWGLHNTGQTVNGDSGTPGADINALEAWDFWTGDPEFRIAVIDTGVDYNHPDLQANIWTNPDEIPGNGIDDDGNGYVDDIHGYDFYEDDNDPMDCYYHGSHVAGTIGAVANNVPLAVAVTEASAVSAAEALARITA